MPPDFAEGERAVKILLVDDDAFVKGHAYGF
jgi:hypothetical protein